MFLTSRLQNLNLKLDVYCARKQTNKQKQKTKLDSSEYFDTEFVLRFFGINM